MDPSTARCRIAAASRPAATPLLQPQLLPHSDQPMLPWSVLPKVNVPPDAPLAPELRQVAVSLLNGVIEVLRGQRSPLQLELWVEPEVLQLLEHLRRGTDTTDLRLHSVRVQSPRPDALEVCAHLRHQGFSRAAALRIVRRRGRWVASQLVLALAANVVQHAGAGAPERAG